MINSGVSLLDEKQNETPSRLYAELWEAEMELERKKDRMIEKMLEQELRKLFNDQ